MSDLGNLLRKAREQRGYSLDDIQDLTKIRKRYLEAIEEGDYKVLPGNFYVRAFVKNYAETVGLDAEEVLRLYQKEIPAPAPEPVQEQPMIKKRRASVRSSDRWSKWGFRLLMWSFLILIVAVVYQYAVKNQDGTDKQTADNETPITDVTEPPLGSGNEGDAGEGSGVSNEEQPDDDAEAPVDEPAIPATTLTFVETAGNVEKYAVSTAGEHTLEIAVADGKDSWIEIRANSKSGEKLHYKTEKGPIVVTKTITGPIYLNIGSTRSVEIKIDGVLLPDGDQNQRRFLIEPPSESDLPSA